MLCVRAVGILLHADKHLSMLAGASLGYKNARAAVSPANGLISPSTASALCLRTRGAAALQLLTGANTNGCLPQLCTSSLLTGANTNGSPTAVHLVASWTRAAAFATSASVYVVFLMHYLMTELFKITLQIIITKMSSIDLKKLVNYGNKQQKPILIIGVKL